MLKRVLYSCALVASCLLLTSSKPKTDKKVDKFEKDFKALCSNLSCVGTGVAVVYDGQVVYKAVSGNVDRAFSDPVTSDSYIGVSSLSYAFPAIAVLQLVDAGKISLSDDISKYFGFEVRNPAFPQDPITVRMLLDGTSSINTEAFGFTSVQYLDAKTNPEFSSVFLPVKPGTGNNVSGVCFTLAAAIVEKVTGERFDEYAAKNIFEPMGIGATYDCTAVPDKSLISTYKWNAVENKFLKQKQAYKPLKFKDYVPGISTFDLAPATGLLMNLDDLTVLLQTYINGMVTPDGKRILSAASAEEFFRPATNRGRYCMGITLNTTAVPDYKFHAVAGGRFGSSVSIYFNREDKVGMVAFCSGSHDERPDNSGIIGNHFNRDIRMIFTRRFID